MKVIDSKTQISLKNILWATDFSERSQAALPYAEAIARRYGSKVYVAHVITPETYEFLPPVALSQVFTELRAGAEREMSDLLDGRRPSRMRASWEMEMWARCSGKWCGSTRSTWWSSGRTGAKDSKKS